MSPLPEPVGRQVDVLYMSPQGHVVVLGTAGSGKTNMAIHRAARLADPQTEHGGATLLVTFNNALVRYLRAIGDERLRDVQVETYHRFARGYLASAGYSMHNAILGDRRRAPLIREAIAAIKEAGNSSSLLDRSADVLDDEISYVQKMGVTTLEDYEAMTRRGRSSVPIARVDRPTLWAVYAEYLRLRRLQRKSWDWDDIATTVKEALGGDSQERHYRHVVIDEGQDFSPEMIRSLVAAIPPDGSLTFFADAAQQIYGRGLSWKRAGLRIDQPVLFRENYRNSKQIARLALAMSAMPHYRDVEDLVEPREPTADGPPVTIVPLLTEADELELAIDQANEIGRTQQVAILFRDRRYDKILAQRLHQPAIKLDRNMPRWPAGPGRYYGTYWAAKGLEFDSVILPFCSAEQLPASALVTAFGMDDAMADDARLLYVGVTRAKRGLTITYSGTITPLLPDDASLYVVIDSL